jgi:hypothetical protein
MRMGMMGWIMGLLAMWIMMFGGLGIMPFGLGGS